MRGEKGFKSVLYCELCIIEIIFQKGSRWLIDNNMIILKKVTACEDLASIPMTKTDIWVQVHQLPFSFMDTSDDVLVGSQIGRMVKYDDENNYGLWRKYMWVRVEISMEKPLKQDLVIEREEGDAIKLISNIQDSLPAY